MIKIQGEKNLTYEYLSFRYNDPAVWKTPNKLRHALELNIFQCEW
jgi:hypothetical protein